MKVKKRLKTAILPIVVTVVATLPASVMAKSIDNNGTATHVAKPSLINVPGEGCYSYYTDRLDYTSYTYLGPKIRAPYKVVARFGATPKEINRKFASVIESHFNSGMAEHIVNRLSDKELAGLAQMYHRSAGVENARLLETFASRLSDKALLRVASAFGRTPVTHAVQKYSSPAVKASFLAHASAIVPLTIGSSILPDIRAGGSGGGLPLPPPKPSTTDWRSTLQEIYLDYKTDPALDLTTGEALSSTVMYTASAIGAAWGAGTAVGDGVSYLITNYDPSLSDAIGGTVAGMFDAGQQSMTELEEGNLEASFDALFGLAISDSTQPYGPYGLADPMVMYYGTYGAPEGFDGGQGWSGICDNPY